MSTFLQFLILGLGLGGLYALVALGLVLVYRVSGIVNFAIAPIGMVGTYVYWELHDNHHWSFAAAIVPSLAASALLGYFVQITVMRRLREASPLVRLLATIGVLLTVQSAIALRYPDETLTVASSLPTGTVNFAGATVGIDRILIFLIVLLLVTVLGVVYRRSTFGMATTAVADDSVALESLGRSAHRIAALNWAIACALAALAGILLAPITGLSIGQLINLVIPALAAAVVGSMVSFPVTFIAALCIGIIESEMSWYVNAPGWSESVPFILIITVLAVRGSTIPGRAFERVKLPAVGSGLISRGGLAVAIVGGLVWIAIVPVNWVNGTAVTVATATILLSFVVVTGYAGQLSLAQYALGGVGAFVAGRLTALADLPFLAALLIGVAAAAPIGFIVGLPAVRTRGAQLAVATLGLSVAIEALIFNNFELTGGGDGTPVGDPEIFGLGMSAILHPRTYAVVTIAVFAVLALAVANLRRGRTGRRLLAVRANERAASAHGVRVVSLKLYAFVIGAMIAAAGGIMFSFRNTVIVYSDFTAFGSIHLVGQAVVGGIGYIIGPIFGGMLQPASLGTNIGHGVFGESFEKFLPLLSGLFMTLILIHSPDGMASHSAQSYRRLKGVIARILRRRPAANQPSMAAVLMEDETSVQPGRVPRKQLEVSDLSVTFGGVKALTSVSLTVQPGRVLGLIGPNGAGKTTLIDAVTGFNTPASGAVQLDGKLLNELSPQARAASGISRSFQGLALFEDMTVLENLLVATEAHRPVHYALDLVRPGKPELTPVARAVIREFDLLDDLDRRASDLPYGKRRLVAIARAIASEPSVLLLDEPAAGLSESERRELVSQIRTVARQRGIGVLLIEHDVDLVMQACDEIVVLDFGQVIACGTPGEVRNDPAVVAAYLGSSDIGDAEVTV